MNKNKSFVCYSLRMARYLALKGNHMNGDAINTNAPWLKVFYFDYTDKLEKDIEKYKATKLKEENKK